MELDEDCFFGVGNGLSSLHFRLCMSFYPSAKRRLGANLAPSVKSTPPWTCRPPSTEPCRIGQEGEIATRESTLVLRNSFSFRYLLLLLLLLPLLLFFALGKPVCKALRASLLPAVLSAARKIVTSLPCLPTFPDPDVYIPYTIVPGTYHTNGAVWVFGAHICR